MRPSSGNTSARELNPACKRSPEFSGTIHVDLQDLPFKSTKTKERKCRWLPAPTIAPDTTGSVHGGHADFGGDRRPKLALCFNVKRPAFRNRCSATLAAEVGRDGLNTRD